MSKSQNLALVGVLGAAGFLAYTYRDLLFGEEPQYENGRLQCKEGFSPVKQEDGSWKCTRMVDPRDKEENKSVMDMDGKTFTVENPNYNPNTNFGKLFKSYGLSYKVVIDSAGRSAEGSATSPNVLVEFEPKPASWTVKGVVPKTITRSVSSGTSWSSITKPSFGELLTALGGVDKSGPYIGPSVSLSSIEEDRPNGSIALIPMTGEGKRESRIRLDIVSGRPNPAFTLGLYLSCEGNFNYQWIQGSASAIGGSYDESTKKWNFKPAIPASAITALNNRCPIQTKTVSPPTEVRVWDGSMTSTGQKSYSSIYVLQGSSASIQLPLDTQDNKLLYSLFYNQSSPAAEKDASGLYIKGNFADADERKIYIPHQYSKKTYECNCPSDSNKAGQKVQMPLPCSNYSGITASQKRSQELMTACGGKKSAPTGPVLGGGGMVSLAESHYHQGFITDFL